MKTEVKIYNAFKDCMPNKTIIDVYETGIRDKLHVLVISEYLDEMNGKQMQEYLFSILEKTLERNIITRQEFDRVTLMVPISIEELKR